MTEIRKCCNCDENYHYCDDDGCKNDPDCCNECSRIMGEMEVERLLDEEYAREEEE